MNLPLSSSHRVPYDLRPRKQIERRMIVHIFQLMAEAGFPISTYRYAGFGAFFFVDFILFRRLLGIIDMVSIEHDIKCENRVKFNRPYKDIDIKLGASSEYVSVLNRDKAHILWLDYDGPIAHDYLFDLETACSRLCPGSVLIATFDVDFDNANDINIKNSTADKRSEAWYHRFKDECGLLMDPTLNIDDFNASEIHKRTSQVALSAILSGINMRDGITYEPIFNFLYADGHTMLTIGGVISSIQERRKLKQLEWNELYFVRRKLHSDPFIIDVPILTRKERLYIDAHMPCREGWSPKDFEIDPDAISIYRQVYRYCPLYAELLL